MENLTEMGMLPIIGVLVFMAVIFSAISMVRNYYKEEAVFSLEEANFELSTFLSRMRGFRSIQIVSNTLVVYFNTSPSREKLFMIPMIFKGYPVVTKVYSEVERSETRIK